MGVGVCIDVYMDLLLFWCGNTKFIAKALTKKLKGFIDNEESF
jgi:hypothetical protein